MNAETDDRLSRNLGDAERAPRAMRDRKVTERRDVSDDDRLQMFRQALFNDALPDLPEIPGYHVCWLTTSNPRDSIYRRMQLGYEPVTKDEVPGMEYATQKTGEFAGMIAVNEMLAFKLPMSLYQRFMQEAHHDAPNREEGKLTDTADFLRNQAERDGTTIVEGEGFSDLRRAVSAPRSFGI